MPSSKWNVRKKKNKDNNFISVMLGSTFDSESNLPVFPPHK